MDSAFILPYSQHPGNQKSSGVRLSLPRMRSTISFAMDSPVSKPDFTELRASSLQTVS